MNNNQTYLITRHELPHDHLVVSAMIEGYHTCSFYDGRCKFGEKKLLEQCVLRG